MADAWLTLDEAAKRVDRSARTLRRWIGDRELRRFPNGKVLESQLLDTDQRMRANAGGRPKEDAKIPLVVDGREVGYVMVTPDGEISGRMTDTPKP